MTSNHRSTIRHKTALTIGFLALTAAIVAAYRRPATGYELSIYASTPTAFWIAISVALLASVTVALAAPEPRAISNTAYALGTLAVISVVAIPVIRSYHYYGSGDSMTHLGWARELRDGVMTPLEFLYPAIHLLSNFMYELGGVTLTRGLVIIPTIVFPLVSILFFGLCVKAATDSRWGFAIGILVGMLFVPINKVSVHVISHPSSQTILFTPFLLYLLIRHLTSESEGFTMTTPFGALFALACTGIVLLHPQESMSFLVLLGGVLVAQLATRRINPYHPIAKHRPVGAHTLLLGVTFLAWTARNERARTRAAYVFQTLLDESDSIGGGTETRTASLVQLGGSIEELFLKLFAVTVVFCAIAGLVSLYAFRNRFRGTLPSDTVVGYLTVGLVPLTAGFLAIFVADQGDHYFRFMGFIMVPVTLMGAIGLTRLMGDADRRLTRAQLTSAVTVLFVVMLTLQMLTIHAGPYIYQGNKQVTEHAMDGHEIAFEHHDGETPMLGIRQGQYRYMDAHFGQTAVRGDLNFPGYREGIPDTIFTENLTTHYEEDQYIVLMDENLQRELLLYKGFRYDEESFARFERDEQINRLQDNGEFRLYRLVVD